MSNTGVRLTETELKDLRDEADQRMSYHDPSARLQQVRTYSRCEGLNLRYLYLQADGLGCLIVIIIDCEGAITWLRSYPDLKLDDTRLTDFEITAIYFV